MQQAINAWHVMDQNISSDTAKKNAEMIKILKGT
jgi:hypothetical protein